MTRLLLAPLTLLLTPILLAQADPPAAEEDSGPSFSGLELRGIGPAFMSGRISDIAVDPADASTWYVAVGSGGVWKTTNRGTTWNPVFDDQASYSIGCVAVDANRPGTVWAGTGENVSGRHVGFGDGIYVSHDGGQSWAKKGLEASEHIGSIVVHPGDSNTLFVAAQGPLWSGGGERGVYKTTDGGESWTQVLAAGPYTGANEVVMDPSNPDVLYAAMHQRLRTVASLVNGGPESGIFKSIDGGDTWERLEGGLPKGNLGKIGLAVSSVDTSVVYATIEEADRDGGFWRSTDGGASWTKRSDYLSGGTGPHYYQEIFASIHDVDRVYQMDVRLHVTDDGGANFRTMSYDAKHSDNHALVQDPRDPEHLVVGCDGGIYETWDHGATWRFCANLPVTQFYKVALDDAEPFYNVFGGTQDNNTQVGPSRTLSTHGITNRDWSVTLFGDGHQPATEPGNPDIAYSEWQQGNLVRVDRTNGEIVYIKPQPAEGEPQERFNWDAPILVSPHDPARLYFASQRVWRSDDRGDSWTPVSGDLTRNVDRLMEPVMDRTWGDDAPWDLYAMSRFSTITSLAESPVQEGLLWAGSDDGLVSVTVDGGATWRALDASNLGGVPERFFVNDIKADRFDARTAYVCGDNHKEGDYRPFVLRTTDGGATWENIGASLPDRHLCWRLVQDRVDRDLLFLGAEFGVFFTRTGGAEWHKLDGGIPTIPVRDLALHPRMDDLVCATFGRGFWILDDVAPLRGMEPAQLEADAALLGARDALWYVPKRDLGAGSPMGRASQGDAFFVAPNPDFGATFTYHVGAELQSPAEARKKAMKDAEATLRPSFDELHAEEDAEAPTVLLTVRDANGSVVRALEAPAAKGFHRVTWDLRRPSQAPWRRGASDDAGREGGGRQSSGSLCAPGTYSVTLAIRANGFTSTIGEPMEFDVTPLGGGALENASPAEVVAFQDELARVRTKHQTAVAQTADALERATALKSVLARTAGAPDGLDARLGAIVSDLRALRRDLTGDPLREELNTPGPVPASERLSFASLGVQYSTYGPTPSHVESLDIAERAVTQAFARIDGVEAALQEIGAVANDIGAPWTPGR
ncbi:MAG: glycosyl hydrolase [Planctomycetota bacterium]